MRAVIYVRQSKERDESTSIEDQERLCRAYCADKGWDVVEVLTDRDTSGSEIPWRKRKEFPRAFDLDADVLVIYRWSRLSRDEFDQVEILKKWGALGRTVQAQAEPVDTTTASGVLHRSMILMFAAHEAREKSERWREALNRRAEAGLPKNGHPRFGYRKDGKSFVPDPEQAPVLRELYLRYAAGAGFQSLCADLNERGVPTRTGKPWAVQTLSRMLDSGFGAGLLVQDTRTTKAAQLAWLPGAHEPVITPDEWQSYLDARNSRRQQAPRRRTAKWFLAGLAVCGKCGGRVIVTSYKDEKSTALCSGYHSGRSCTGVWIKRQTLEQRVAVWLGGHLEDLPERDEVAPEVESNVRDLESRLTETQDALGRLAEGWATGVLDADGYRAAQTSLLEKRRVLEAELRGAREEQARLAPLDRDIYSRLELGDADTPGEWNGLIGKVLRRVEVHKDRLVLVPVVGEESIISR